MLEVSRRGQRGGTILGFMIGLIVGLGIAVFVAIFVTRAPVPFVNKANKSSDRVVEPKSPAEAPDPNKPMYSKSRPNGTPADGSAPPTAGAPVPAPAPAAPPAAAPVPPQAATVIKPPEVKTPEPRPLDPKAGDATKDDRASYLLQAGAFRSQGDADGMKAKLALLGFEARVLTADVNGQTMFRVRVGPYGQLEDMNRVRAKLAENGIEASVIRQR